MGAKSSIWMDMLFPMTRNALFIINADITLTGISVWLLLLWSDKLLYGRDKLVRQNALSNFNESEAGT